MTKLKSRLLHNVGWNRTTTIYDQYLSNAVEWKHNFNLLLSQLQYMQRTNVGISTNIHTKIYSSKFPAQTILENKYILKYRFPSSYSLPHLAKWGSENIAETSENRFYLDGYTKYPILPDFFYDKKLTIENSLNWFDSNSISSDDQISEVCFH